jgi:CRISPR-associated protein Cmr1
MRDEAVAMQSLEIEIRTVMPTFLGGADQSSEWRTPPIKALLRQWWRIVRAPACGFDHVKLREEEANLFGHAWLKSEAARQSRVRLQLKTGWGAGTIRVPGNEPRVMHPEVGQGGRQVGAKLYLGFGPLVYDREQRGTILKSQPAIASASSATLRMTFPPEVEEELLLALGLMHCFGSLGGRSRNGWGSVEILKKDGTLLGDLWSKGTAAQLDRVARPLEDCLKLDWPHALGRDGNGVLLLWQTKAEKNVDEVVKTLAEIKIGLRTAVQFDVKRIGKLDRRHLLAYPVTNHDVTVWYAKNSSNPRKRGGRLDAEGRLANQLRFKIARRDGQFVGVIYHLPARLPAQLRRALDREDQRFVAENEVSTWQTVHEVLDRQANVSRYRGTGGMPFPKER